MNAFKNLMVLVCCLSLVAVGCGEDENGDNDDNGGSGIDTSQMISEMDDDDAQALCDATEDLYESADEEAGLEGACKLSGYFTGAFAPEDNVAACEAAYDDCMEDDEENGENGEATCGYVDLGEDREECEATAGDSLDCTSEMIDGLIAFGENFECAQLDDEEIDADAEAAIDNFMGEGSACQAYYDACPINDPSAE